MLTMWCVLSASVALSVAVPSSPHPTIVSILADDLGYHDRSVAGNVNVSTPALDALYHSGITLKHFYAYKYCSPSRRAFVTGRWPLHLGEANQLADGIDLRMSTLANKLKTVGYTNVLIGKTHWGVATTRHLPVNRGFDSHLGYLGGAEAYWSGHQCVNEGTNCDTFTTSLDMWHDERPGNESQYLGKYSTDLFTKLAVATIAGRGAAAAPLWLHLNYQAVHNPQTSPPGKSHCNDDTQQVFFEVLEAMDRGIANVTAALHAAGLWENALVIFQSDNGAASSGNNYPLRGGKYKPFEGGVRVQAALTGGLVPAAKSGTTFEGLVHVSDWFPTLCGLAGVVDCTDSPAADATPEEWFWPVDGVDIWDFATADGPDPRRGEPHGVPVVLSSPYTSGSGGGAMLLDHYKLVNNAHDDKWDGPYYTNKGAAIHSNQSCLPDPANITKNCIVCSIEKPCLYDVWADEREFHNLAAAEPALLKLLNDTYTELVFNMRKVVPLNFTVGNGWVCDGQGPTAQYGDAVHTAAALPPPAADDGAPGECAAASSTMCWRTSGHTVVSLPNVGSAAKCCAACSNTTGCGVWSLDGSRCWLLDFSAKTGADTGCHSGTVTPQPDPGPPIPPGPPPGPPPPCSGPWGCFTGPTCRCPSGACEYGPTP